MFESGCDIGYYWAWFLPIGMVFLRHEQKLSRMEGPWFAFVCYFWIVSSFLTL
jgi:hypothetical protein